MEERLGERRAKAMGTDAPDLNMRHRRIAVPKDAVAQSDSSSGGSSFGQTISRPFQTSGTSSSAAAEDDPVSLKTEPKVGVELYVAVAHLYLESGKFTEAEDQYQQAYKIAPNDIRVLLGYAMLKDQVNQPQEALKFDQQAEKKYPKQASVYNNLSIHYVRYNMVREAIEAGRRAVALRPREPRYRNNLAPLLVEAGDAQEASSNFARSTTSPWPTTIWASC